MFFTNILVDTKGDALSLGTDVENNDQRKADRSNSCIVNDPMVIKDLLAHRDVICLPFQRDNSARYLTY